MATLKDPNKILKQNTRRNIDNRQSILGHFWCHVSMQFANLWQENFRFVLLITKKTKPIGFCQKMRLFNHIEQQSLKLRGGSYCVNWGLYVTFFAIMGHFSSFPSQQKFPVQWSPHERWLWADLEYKCSFPFKHWIHTKPASML